MNSAVTKSLSNDNIAWWTPAVWVAAKYEETVLSRCIQVRDDSAACVHICHVYSLVLVSWRIILLEVNHEAVNGNTFFWVILSHMVQCTTVQHSTAQHSTAQHSTVQYSTVQHSTAQHSAIVLSIPLHVLYMNLQLLAKLSSKYNNNIIGVLEYAIRTVRFLYEQL